MLVTLLMLGGAGYARSVMAPPSNLNIEIPVPTMSDWLDLGEIFTAGELGEWDFQLWGGFTNAVVKKDDTFFLYYQGASGYRTTPDETVTWRAVGVATSQDGINFTKSDENPIITWFPNGNGEEGAVSAGAALGDNGEIVLFYGANSEESRSTVNSDGRLAVSIDGVHFADQGVVLDRRDRSLWASGDEIFPILALHASDKWIVYYLPNGRLHRRHIGVAWGSERQNLNDSAAARQGLSSVLAWGTGGQARIGPGSYALLFNNVPTGEMQVRLMSERDPQRLSEPVAKYEFEGVSQATFMLDEAASTWFMFYRRSNGDGYGVMVAPAGATDTTPPTVMAEPLAEPINHNQIKLTWDPAFDADTGIATYAVIRDGQLVATVKGWEFIDEGLTEQKEYHYQIAATNYHGLTGAPGPKLAVTTLPDSTAPLVTAIHAGPSPSDLVVTFDEPVEPASAERTGNYQIAPELIIYRAALSLDQKTVILRTSPHENNLTYRALIRDIRDQSRLANTSSTNTWLPYTYSEIAGLVGAWNFDQAGERAIDTANFGNDGSLAQLGQFGPTRVAGVAGKALLFDGFDDQVIISGAGSLAQLTDHSYTISLWAQPEGRPSAETPNLTDYTLLARRFNGLYFDEKGQFRAQMQLRDGGSVQVTSEPIEGDQWHHVAMVGDEETKQLHLFVDGWEVPDSPVGYEGDLAIQGEAPYYIGTSDLLRNRYENRFTGRVDEVRLFDRALAAYEVQSIFQTSN